jgi:hypothetical protein
MEMDRTGIIDRGTFMMNSQTQKRHMVSRFRFIGAGIVLSTIWWVLSVSKMEQLQLEMLESGAIAIGGFIPAVIGMLWIGSKVSTDKKQAKASSEKTWIWVILSLVYPVGIMAALIWNTVDPIPWLTRLLTHLAILILNLTAVFLIGPFMSMSDLTEKFGTLSKRNVSGKVGELILFVAWWLWHLPFIFLNGNALSKLNFSTPLLSLYLGSILLLSYFITWGDDSDLRNEEI